MALTLQNTDLLENKTDIQLFKCYL